MPATLIAPVSIASAAGILIKNVRLNVENGTIEHEAQYVDANGNALGVAPPYPMAHAAWMAAIQGAGGSLKTRVYTVYLAQAGLAASGIT